MAEYGQPPNVWQSEIVICKGGLSLETDAITSGTTQQGSGKILQNFECALEGGYRRINGYTKYDTNTVPGTAGNPVLGVKVALEKVFAARKTNGTPSTDIYYSTGSGWSARINTANRGGSPTRVRFITYTISQPVIVGCDGVNPAFKYDGTTYTLLNSAGAPADPKYAEMFNASLVLAGYSANPQNLTISAPNSDTDFTAANGAIEINIGDQINGIKNFRNAVYVFCKNRIFKIVTDPNTIYAVSQVTDQIGCLHGDTIQEIGGDLVYLAPDGFRSVAGTYNIGDVDLSLQSRSIQPLIRQFILNNTSVSQFPSCAIRKKSQYRCWLYDPNVAQGNSIGFIGKLERASSSNSNSSSYAPTQYSWSTMLGIKPYCVDSYFDIASSTADEHVVMGDSSNGYVYQLESGNDFDGIDIVAAYVSPYLTFKDASLRKVMQKATIYTQAEGLSTINLSLLFDFQNSGILQPASTILAINGNFPTYGGSVYGTDMYASVQFPVFKPNLVGSGFTTAFQYTSTGGAPYRIDSYQIIYGQKGRR